MAARAWPWARVRAGGERVVEMSVLASERVVEVSVLAPMPIFLNDMCACVSAVASWAGAVRELVVEGCEREGGRRWVVGAGASTARRSRRLKYVTGVGAGPERERAGGRRL